MDLLFLCIGAALAAIVGYSAQRASICSVRAVAEVMDRREFALLASFAKSAAWAMAIAIPAGWAAFGEIEAAFPPLGIAAVAGGALFGFGAALNNGCAVSTASHLASGDGAMLLTLLGFGAAALAVGESAGAAPAAQEEGAALLASPGALASGVVALAWLWAIVELRRLLARPRPHRNLTLAALAIGLCSGLLFVLQGPWAYSAALVQAAGFAAGQGSPPGLAALALFAALLSGAWLSAWRSGQFRLRWKGERPWHAHLIGGALMGGGAALVPGGNDAVLLHATPLLAEHALPAYAAMLVGAAAGILLRRVAAGTALRPAMG